jgi:hypothetical protein
MFSHSDLIYAGIMGLIDNAPVWGQIVRIRKSNEDSLSGQYGRIFPPIKISLAGRKKMYIFIIPSMIRIIKLSMVY